MNLNEQFDVKCTDLTYEGLGVCKIENQVVFVEHLLPNEEAKINITEVKKSFAYGEIVELVNSTNKRIYPKCPVFFECGGCDISHMNNELKRDVKYNSVVNNFKKQGLNVDVIDKLEGLDLYGYRSKVVMHAKNIDGKVMVGPYIKNSYNVVSNDCLMLNDSGRQLHQDVVALINKFNLKAYEYLDRSGILRDVVYRRNDSDQYMIIFVVTKITKELETIAKIISKLDLVVSIVFNINKGKRHILMSNKNIYNYGGEYLTYQISNVLFNVSPNSFFQINTKVMESMYQVIKDNVEESELVLDAYSGVGSISIFLANKVREIVGIEINESSHKNALLNKKINGLKNIKFINGDISEEVKRLNYNFKTIITDPPRNGCSKEFINFIIENKFNKLIYMSCNSATQARDLKLLSEIYNIEKIYAFDMFAHTSHVETIAILKKK